LSNYFDLLFPFTVYVTFGSKTCRSHWRLGIQLSNSFNAAIINTNTHDTLTRNWRQKLATVSDTSHMQFGIEFFWYQFLLTNTTCSIFVPVYSTSFLVRIFGADFSYVCHEHQTTNRTGTNKQTTARMATLQSPSNSLTYPDTSRQNYVMDARNITDTNGNVPTVISNRYVYMPVITMTATFLSEYCAVLPRAVPWTQNN